MIPKAVCLVAGTTPVRGLARPQRPQKMQVDGPCVYAAARAARARDPRRLTPRSVFAFGTKRSGGLGRDDCPARRSSRRSRADRVGEDLGEPWGSVAIPGAADRPLIWGSGRWCAHPGRSRASKDGGDLDLAAKSRPFAEISENSCGTHEGMGSIRGSTPRFRQRYGNRAVVERAVGTIQLGGDPDDSVRDESACSQA
jgi:hypothetical protein